ncbi:MAG: chemotaxis protein CheW [Verrucomicrobiales bacterium]|nr:chemotaxis protein CheW [Verrucomicrobiales bacterium]
MNLPAIDITNLSEAELEALTAPEIEFAATGIDPSDASGTTVQFAPEAIETAALEAMDAVEIPEPEMDELLAELLAQEPSLEMAPDSVDELPLDVPSDMGLLASPEPVSWTVPEPVFEASAAAEQHVAPPDETLDTPVPEPEMPAILAMAAGNEDQLLAETVPLQPEPVELEALAEPAAEPAEFAVEAFAEERVELASEPVPPEPLAAAPVEEPVEAPVEVELPAEPAPPQPALEAVVRSIDRALETAPPVVSVAESAAPAHHHKQFSQLDDYVVFTLAGTDYAVPVRDVAEIGRIPSITRLPNVPDFIRGITNLRGEVVPVLSLPVLLGLQDAPATARGRVLFLQPREKVSSTGLVVDEVKGIQRIQSQQLEQVTGLVDDKVTAVLRGVHGRGDRLLNVLDLEQLFHLQEFQQLESR